MMLHARATGQDEGSISLCQKKGKQTHTNALYLARGMGLIGDQ
jgi:hypothetical protein